jgi:hypothetical protein
LEWSDEKAAQESTRCGSRQIGWVGPERGQTAGQPAKWPQGRLGQEPQETNCGTAQRQTPTTWAPEEALVVAITTIRSRFGYDAIGLGCNGISYSAAAFR